MPYPWFTSGDATDGSSDYNYLLQDTMELSTLQRMIGVYLSGYGNSYKAIYGQWVDDATMNTDMITGIIVYWWL